nr:hypothetical protein [Tanacetum cinerariifolium]
MSIITGRRRLLDGGKMERFLGGRDEVAGGIWLACTREGRVSFLTNVLELHTLPEAKSRGDLPLRFLESKKSSEEFAKELVKEVHEYNGFNLITLDLTSNKMFYISNRTKNEPPTSQLPNICSLEWEHSLSSIFVEVDTPLGRYGTRSMIALSIKDNEKASFHETYIEKGIPPMNGREYEELDVLLSELEVFAWKVHPLYPFLLLLNRDEYHHRPTKAVGWWEDGEILGGRDEVAGGTWLACTREGRVSFLTNVLELHTLPEAKSRGDLPLRFLESKKSSEEFAKELVKELDSPWPKVQRLKLNFKKLLSTYDEDEDIPMNEMIHKLMRDTTKADKNQLPNICSLEWEHSLSSIFVEVDTPLGRYGTRSMIALSIKDNEEATFHETYIEKGIWWEKTVDFYTAPKVALDEIVL